MAHDRLEARAAARRSTFAAEELQYSTSPQGFLVASDPASGAYRNVQLAQSTETASGNEIPFAFTSPTPQLESALQTNQLFLVAVDSTYLGSFENLAWVAGWKLQALVGAMHKAGVPIVAGTDGSGLELVRELELYVQAGFSNAEALASATIATAHLVGADQRTGSIKVGKAADLVLVDGNPAVNIGDLRHTELVVMDGKLMDANALRAEGGISKRPAWEE